MMVAMAEIKFFGYLAEKVGYRTKRVSLDKPTPLRHICPLPFREEDVLILIDEKMGHFDSLIEDKDFVSIMPMLSGG
jgi:molybdopterin converting factor small subunit